MEKIRTDAKASFPAGVFAVGTCAIPLVGAVSNRARVPMARLQTAPTGFLRQLVPSLRPQIGQDRELLPYRESCPTFSVLGQFVLFQGVPTLSGF